MHPLLGAATHVFGLGTYTIVPTFVLPQRLRGLNVSHRVINNKVKQHAQQSSGAGGFCLSYRIATRVEPRLVQDKSR